MKSILLLLLSAIAMSYTVPEWVRVDLDHRVTVSFPMEPKQMENNGNKVWSVQADSSCMYMALIVDFVAFGLDSAGVAQSLGEESFYSDFKSSMVAQMGEAKVISEERVSVNGRPAYNLVVSRTIEGSEIDMIYVSNIFVGDRMYSLSFYDSSKHPQSVNRKKFFDSFTVH